MSVDPQTVAAISEIMKQGFLGSTTVVACAATYKLFVMLLAEKDARRQDREQFNTLLQTERDARLADRGTYSQSLLEVNAKLLTATNQLAETADKLLEARDTMNGRRPT